MEGRTPIQQGEELLTWLRVQACVCTWGFVIPRVCLWYQCSDVIKLVKNWMRVGCWLSLRICVLCSTFWHKILSLGGAELCSCPETIVSITRIFPVHSFFFYRCGNSPAVVMRKQGLWLWRKEASLLLLASSREMNLCMWQSGRHPCRKLGLTSRISLKVMLCVWFEKFSQLSGWELFAIKCSLVSWF
jgi:hypothetical protein